MNPEKHHCGMKKCKVCKEYYERLSKHRCFMQPKKDPPKDKEGYNQLIFFDFECRQENGNHEPNLCVVRDEANVENVFEGDDTHKKFCEWLFTAEHANCIMVAHNFQGYDSYFILQYLRENGVQYDVIMRGAKVLTLSVPQFKVKFIDSLSFIPMRLAAFPKTFGLTELAKGYFPHRLQHQSERAICGRDS